MEPRWTAVSDAAELPVGGVRTTKGTRGVIALFRVDEHTVRAVDDRCPHEGYPLAQGSVCGEVLTCCHHNFKFDLRDGRCLLGDEAVGVYPAKVEDGRIWVDLAERDPEQQRTLRWSSLDRALFDGKLGQMARDVVRLLDLGATPPQIAAFTAAWDADHAPYGSSHALPLSVVALEIAAPGLEAAHALVPALEVAMEESTRSPAHPVAAAVEPGPEGLVAALRAAIDAEDLPRVEGLVRWGAADPLAVRTALLLATTDHLVDYGHSLIYTVAAWKLQPHATRAQRESVWVGLVRSIVQATRDDTVPAWSTYRKQIAGLPWAELAGGTGSVDPSALAAELVAATGRDSVEVVRRALVAGAPGSVIDGLALAAAERLLRFDVRHDADSGVQDGWLDVTHTQTFVHAIREAWSWLPAEDAVRWLFQAARLIARVRPLDREGYVPVEPLPGDLREAILARDPERAAAIAWTSDPDQVRPLLVDLALGDLAVRPIFVAHHLKQVVAGCAEAVATGDPRPLAAAARFLASPKSERRTLHRVGEALALVRDGRPPKVLGF